VDGRDGNASWGERGRAIPSLRGWRRHGEGKAWRGGREREGREGALSVLDRQCQAHGGPGTTVRLSQSSLFSVAPIQSLMFRDAWTLTPSVAVLKFVNLTYPMSSCPSAVVAARSAVLVLCFVRNYTSCCRTERRK
jgi:hypothetical protein